MSRTVWTVVVTAVTAAPVFAQDDASATRAVAQPLAVPTMALADAAAGVEGAAGGEPGGASLFVHDVLHDYRNFISKQTLSWLGAGMGAALATHASDDSAKNWLNPAYAATQSISGGQAYGSDYVQFPLAVVWWSGGALLGSDRHADAGRDLLRAQISATSWTYALKYTVNRTRPNGDPRSFPSGHASSTFATAVVLQDHYGWKLGVPFMALGLYTSFSRVQDNKHWASDVVFGAFLGAASAKTVTLHVRNRRLALAPEAVPGGAVVRASVTR